MSFIAWKDEAFAIGGQWAKIYPEGSKSRALIEGIMDSYYLVNVRLALSFSESVHLTGAFVGFRSCTTRSRRRRPSLRPLRDWTARA